MTKPTTKDFPGPSQFTNQNMIHQGRICTQDSLMLYRTLCFRQTETIFYIDCILCSSITSNSLNHNKQICAFILLFLFHVEIQKSLFVQRFIPFAVCLLRLGVNRCINVLFVLNCLLKICKHFHRRP